MLVALISGYILLSVDLVPAADNFEHLMCAALKLNIHDDLLKFTLESASKTISISNYNVLLLF